MRKPYTEKQLEKISIDNLGYEKIPAELINLMDVGNPLFKNSTLFKRKKSDEDRNVFDERAVDFSNAYADYLLSNDPKCSLIDQKNINKNLEAAKVALAAFVEGLEDTALGKLILQEITSYTENRLDTMMGIKSQKRF